VSRHSKISGFGGHVFEAILRTSSSHNLSIKALPNISGNSLYILFILIMYSNTKRIYRYKRNNSFEFLIGSVDCVDVLIKSGALLNIYDCNFGTPLHAAVFQNQYKCVKRLLQAGANVNATKFHETPLHLAVFMNHIESALELLRFGANVFLTNNSGKRAIDLLRKKSGPLYEALVFAQRQPLSLQDLCRQVLIKNQSLNKLYSLFYLPQSLVDFINYEI
jgi:ankyrin repeat protein